jgi:hypothetical protein
MRSARKPTAVKAATAKRHRHHQQAQLTRPQVTPQLTRTQLQTMHPRLLVHALTITRGEGLAGLGAWQGARPSTKNKKARSHKTAGFEFGGDRWI